MSGVDPELERFLALPPAERVLERFRVLEPLGKGGFAPVWRAVETYGDHELREVAMKLFTVKQDGKGREGRARKEAIVAEARALCRVEHPNVVRFYNFASNGQGTVFGLVMEYVRGASLDKLLELRGALDAAEAVDVGVAIASALAAVHAQGIVHRDIKPANVIDSKGVYKVIDFGIASAGARARLSSLPEAPRESIVLDDLPLEAGHTKVSMAPGTLGDMFASMSGTVGYVDPLCISELRPADAMSDLYALGATLYECLTGALPATAYAKAHGRSGISGEVLDGRARPPPVVKLAPKTPAALGAIVDKLLAPDLADRFGSAEEVVHALRAVSVKARSRFPPLAVAGGVAALGLLAVVAYELRPRDEPRRLPPPPPPSTASSVPLSPPAPPVGLTHRCSESAPDGGCIPWCDTEGIKVACCPPGNAPLGPDSTCGCPPGGSDALGCPAATISDAELNRRLEAAIDGVRPALRRCFDGAGGDGGTGSVRIAVELAPNGAVFSARVAQGDVTSEAMQRCILGELRKVRFPPPPGGSWSLVVPISFLR